MKIVQDIEERLRDCREGSWRDQNKSGQLWTMIQKKRILIGTDFGAIFLVQMILISLDNAWMIGMIMNGERNRRRD